MGNYYILKYSVVRKNLGMNLEIANVRDKILLENELNEKTFSEFSVYFQTILSTYENLKYNLEYYSKETHKGILGYAGFITGGRRVRNYIYICIFYKKDCPLKKKFVF